MHDLFSGLSAANGPLWAAIAGLAALMALAALTALMLTVVRGERSRGEAAAEIGRLADVAERLATAQAELAGAGCNRHRQASTSGWTVSHAVWEMACFSKLSAPAKRFGCCTNAWR